MYEDLEGRPGILKLQEAKRNPLEGIDSLVIPDTKVWGQSRMPGDKTSNKNISTRPMEGQLHGPSDADERTDKEQGNKPTRGPSVDNPISNKNTPDSVLESIRKVVEAEKEAGSDKFERCVQHVKAKGDDVNPWAVCHASTGETKT